MTDAFGKSHGDAKLHVSFSHCTAAVSDKMKVSDVHKGLTILLETRQAGSPARGPSFVGRP